MKSTQIRLAARPEGSPVDSDFSTREEELPPVGDGQVLLRNIYLSLDPYMRGRMSDAKSYAAPWEVGDVLEGATVSEVVESGSGRYSPGDVVLAYTGWQTYAVASEKVIERKLNGADVPVSTALGVLGMPGFTAYSGLLAIGRPQPGETVVVAAATGPVGSAVGQIAKLKGARAVGIAGGPEKCRALIDEFGFDAAIDHKSPSFADDLAAATPDGVDVYFENVGGHVGEAVIRRLNTYGRVAVCGLIAGYSGDSTGSSPAAALMHRVLIKSLTIRGFIQHEFIPEYRKDFLNDMSAWVRDGSVKYLEDVVDGLENAPQAFQGLLTGKNFGKLIVKVSDDPGTGAASS